MKRPLHCTRLAWGNRTDVDVLTVVGCDGYRLVRCPSRGRRQPYLDEICFGKQKGDSPLRRIALFHRAV